MKYSQELRLTRVGGACLSRLSRLVRALLLKHNCSLMLVSGKPVRTPRRLHSSSLIEDRAALEKARITCFHFHFHVFDERLDCLGKVIIPLAVFH